MPKIVVLLRRRADLTREQFIEYYETRHVPLIHELLPGFSRYVRNYVVHSTLSTAAQLPGDTPEPYFDVITELWFDTPDDYARYRAAARDVSIGARIQADEMNFLDRSVRQKFEVDEFS